MRPKPYTRAEAAFVVGVPLAWGVLLLFHPTGDEYYAVISDSVTPWLVVHLGTMLFIPLLAAAMFVLLRGIEGTAATVSRVALVVFAVVYAAFEVTVGIGSGILGDAINALPAGERAAGAELLASYNESGVITVLSTIGGIAWLVAVAAAGLALFRRARTASSIAVVALFLRLRARDRHPRHAVRAGRARALHRRAAAGDARDGDPARPPSRRAGTGSLSP